MPATPGTIGRYEIHSELGRGDITVVWKAKDSLLNRSVAVKTLRQGFTVSGGVEDWNDRFRRQVELAGALDHPRIVRLLDAGRVGYAPYLVTELGSFRPLHELMADGSLEPALKLAIAGQVLEALHHAHGQGVTHEGIKPTNVLVAPDGQAKVTDFGLSRLSLPATTSITTSVAQPALLRPHYRSPEQILGKKVDGRSDIFSAGVLLYELLLGRRPFDGDSQLAVTQQILGASPPWLDGQEPAAARLGVPEPLLAVLRRSLAKDPIERYQDAAEMRADLLSAASAIGDRAIATAAVLSAEPPPGAPDRNVALLLDVSRALPKSLNVDEALHIIMDAAVELTGAERGLVMLREPGGGFRTRLARQIPLAEAGTDGPRASSTIVDMCIETKQPVAVPNVDEVRELSHAKSIQEMRLKTILCVPLLLRGEVMGVFYLDARAVRRPMHKAQIEVLTAFAAQAAVTLENARLHELATLDALTRLYLRRHFDQRLREEFQRAMRHARPLSLLFLDLDHFKQVNDRRGHLVGDRVLQRVSSALIAQARVSDIAARYGGEEFVLLAPETPLQGAHILAERIRERIRSTTQEDGDDSFKVTVSIGVSTLEGSGATRPEMLVELADRALYEAKSGGRDRVCVAGGSEGFGA